MIKSRFSNIVDATFKKCRDLLVSKGRDYTKDNADMLHNFKSTAEDMGITTMQVWGVYAKKHNDAIANYVKSGGQSESEPIEERIADAINYNLLLLAIIEDNKSSIIEEKQRERQEEMKKNREEVRQELRGITNDDPESELEVPDPGRGRN